MSDNVGSGPRSVALVGPYTSGKTTLLESLLFATGAITRKGRVPDRNTTGDSSPEARERQMSVEINAASFTYNGTRINVLDCPGSVEFAQETLNALMGVDLAIIVCEPQTERVLTLSRLLHFLEEQNIPHVLFANRIDEATVRVAELVDALKPFSKIPFIPCQVAIRDGAQATGYVDLISGPAACSQSRAVCGKSAPTPAAKPTWSDQRRMPNAVCGPPPPSSPRCVVPSDSTKSSMIIPSASRLTAVIVGDCTVVRCAHASILGCDCKSGGAVVGRYAGQGSTAPLACSSWRISASVGTCRPVPSLAALAAPAAFASIACSAAGHACTAA